MKISTFSFTDEGRKLEDRITDILVAESFRGENIDICRGKSIKIEEVFYNSDCLIFIGATGIAVRKVAPFLKDKLKDPAILVIDESGQFVIPLASGHVGGANRLARLISLKINAIPVITTATDVEGVFSVDEFAAENDLLISGKDGSDGRIGIRKVAKKLLSKDTVSIAFDDDVIISTNDDKDALLNLVMRPYIVGMGCKKDKDKEEVEAYFLETLSRLNVDIKNVLAITSIDVKNREPALVELSKKYGIRFVTFSAEELKAVEGDFDESAFVEATVGVSDVSARAAKCLGKNGKFILKKDKKDGMTISVFEKLRRVNLSYE